MTKIHTFSLMQAQMSILLGNIEQYAEQGRQPFQTHRVDAFFLQSCHLFRAAIGDFGLLAKLPKFHRFIARNSSKMAAPPERATTCHRAGLTSLPSIAKSKLPRQLPDRDYSQSRHHRGTFCQEQQVDSGRNLDMTPLTSGLCQLHCQGQLED